MDKFAREKARKRDLVLNKGSEPIRLSIRKDDEYLSKEDIDALQRRAETQVAPKKREHAAVSSSPRTKYVSVFESLSPEAKGLFSQVFFFHPDTVIDTPIKNEAGEITEFPIMSYNRVFFEHLVSALEGYDQKRLQIRRRKKPNQPPEPTAPSGRGSS